MEVVEEEPITKEVEITEPVPVEPEPIIVQPVLSVSATFQHSEYIEVFSDIPAQWIN